ncbi:hypothetical protein [Streptomyces nigrescens]|uniref:hypothetical protein n=1 Tax=Streptomyces nigrescens TaxID=1920 RepID=UPI00369E4188
MSPELTDLEIAAKALYELGGAHAYVSFGYPPNTWEATTEENRKSYRMRASRAQAETFEEYYAFMTLAEASMGHQVPDVNDTSTERVRGHLAEYHLVQFLTRIDGAYLGRDGG